MNKKIKERRNEKENWNVNAYFFLQIAMFALVMVQHIAIFIPKRKVKTYGNISPTLRNKN